jgi:hypothetical protein
MPKKMCVPFCVGEYEKGDVNCDGSPSGTDLQMRCCSWRDRCVAFRKHIRETGETYEQHIELVLDEKSPGGGEYSGYPLRGRKAFMDWCDSLVKKYNIEEGTEKQTISPHKRIPLKRARRVAIRRFRAKARARKNVLDSIFEHFKTHFIENLEIYKFTPPRGVVKPGRFYVIDRRKTSKYISIYFKQPGVLGIPIVLLRLKPRTMTYDIELPASVSDFTSICKDTLKIIRPRPVDNGRFKSICVGMGMEGAAIVAQTIAKLIKRGKIKLPPSG